jgi:nicotinamide mononucleotide transporter
LSFLEIFAVAFGLASVVLTVRQSVWCWPTGLVQVTLYIFVFHSARLYSDMILHVIYVGLQLYGWHHWLRGGQARQAPAVSRLAPVQLLLWSAAVVAAALGWGEVMERHTDAALAHLDAFIATASLCAQYLLARKKLESWLFWIVVDVVAIGVYWSRGLELTAALYAVFLCLCLAGLAAWYRSLALA